MVLTGVLSVDAKYEKNEVKVKGFIETKKIQERLQKWTKKKVDIISETKSKVQEKITKEKKVRPTCPASIGKKRFFWL